jgi:DNA-binding response OmpR family regulator
MDILLVEDEAAIREAEAAYLRRAGYAVVEVADGRDALAAFARAAPDLVVLDLNLPGVDGLEVCRRMRRASAVPIIVVTARTREIDELAGLETGADDYLRKPFNPQILVARVGALLRRVGELRVRVGPFSLDPDRMAVCKGGVPIALTTTQFNILYRLAARPGVVLSRDQLIEAAHDDSTGRKAIFDRTIDAHIRAIRTRIEDEPGRPRHLQTVIGRGYRFVG